MNDNGESSGVRDDGQPYTSPQNCPLSAIRFCVRRGVFRSVHTFDWEATHQPVLRYYVDHRVSLRVFIDSHRISIWMVSLHGLNSWARAVLVEYPVHRLPLVYLSSICKLLLGAELSPADTRRRLR